MLRRPLRRRGASITSLIDVIFLLLLFFMLASTFSRFSEVEIVTTANNGTTSAPQREVITLQLTKTGIVLNGVVISEDDLLPSLRRRSSNEAAALSINIAADVTTQRLVDILADVSAISNLDITLVEGS